MLQLHPCTAAPTWKRACLSRHISSIVPEVNIWIFLSLEEMTGVEQIIEIEIVEKVVGIIACTLFLLLKKF
jgi:hypothetical protein